MPKTPQIGNDETRKALGTTPLGWRYVDTWTPQDDSAIIASDAPAETIRLAGQRFQISGSGRIRMA